MLFLMLKQELAHPLVEPEMRQSELGKFQLFKTGQVAEISVVQDRLSGRRLQVSQKALASRKSEDTLLVRGRALDFSNWASGKSE